MCARRGFTAPLLSACLLILAAGCDLGRVLLSDDELDAMYALEFSQRGEGVLNGAPVDPAQPLLLDVGADQRAPAPASVEVVLTRAEGDEAARVSFAAAGSRAAAPEVRAVEPTELSGRLPPIMLPDGLAPGYYTLTVTALGEAGNRLARSAIAILIYGGELPQVAIAAYPATANAGKASLFKLVADFPADTRPWVRWTVDGETALQGPVSDFSDRLVWKAPLIAGMHLVKAEVYPFRPPVSVTVAPAAMAELKAPVSATAETGEPAWAADLDVPAALDLTDGFSLSGSVPVRGEPILAGIPRPEPMGASFGYVLGSVPDSPAQGGAGILLPFDMLGGLGGQPMSIVLELMPMPAASRASGTLLETLDAEGNAVFSLGVREGVPYARLGDQTAYAQTSMGRGATSLAVSVLEEDGGLRIIFNKDNQPAGESLIPAVGPASALPGAATRTAIAGSAGYPAVYASVTAIRGPYPAFRMGAFAAYGKRLVAATAFEGGQAGSGIQPVGPVALSEGSATLSPGGLLLLYPADTAPADPLLLSWTLRDGAVDLVVPLAGGSSLSLRSSGTVTLNGQLVGAIRWAPGESATLVPSAGGLTVSSGDSVLFLPGCKRAAEQALLVLPAGTRPATLSRFLLAVAVPSAVP